jgi:hypothetical protein
VNVGLTDGGENEFPIEQVAACVWDEAWRGWLFEGGDFPRSLRGIIYRIDATRRGGKKTSRATAKIMVPEIDVSFRILIGRKPWLRERQIETPIDPFVCRQCIGGPEMSDPPGWFS